MDAFEPVVPEARNIPMLTIMLIVAVLAVGLLFAWPGSAARRRSPSGRRSGKEASPRRPSRFHI